MQGMAQSNERISEMLRNTTRQLALVLQAELVEIVAPRCRCGAKDQRRVSCIQIALRLSGPAEAAKRRLLQCVFVAGK